MSELLTLPAGDPERGFVVPLKDTVDAEGVSPPAEETWIADALAAREADFDRVTQDQNDIAAARAEAAATAAAGVRVSSIWPQWASVRDDDLTVRIFGSRFTPLTVILWNGGEETTEFVSSTEVRTGVKPSTVFAPTTVPVSVVGASDEVLFQFTP